MCPVNLMDAVVKCPSQFSYFDLFDPNLMLFLPLWHEPLWAPSGSTFQSMNHVAPVTMANTGVTRGTNFSGDDYYSTSGVGNLEITATDSLTIIAWVKLKALLDDQPTDYPSIVCNQVASYQSRNYTLSLDKPNKRITFHGRNNAGGWTFDAGVVDYSSYNNTDIHCIIAVYDRLTAYTHIYIDALLIDSTSGQGGAAPYSNAGLILQVGSAAAQILFINSYIKELALLTRAFSKNEVNNYYQNTQFMRSI